MRNYFEDGQFNTPRVATVEPSFNLSGHQNTDRSVTVEVVFKSSSLEPVFQRGDARPTNGEPHDALFFNAAVNALNMDRHGLTFLARDNVEDGGTQVLFQDRTGELWKAQGPTFNDALATGLEAVSQE